MNRLLLLALCAAAAARSAGAANWTVANPDFAGVGLSVTATAHNTLIAPVGSSGQGSFVLRSADGGKTFAKLPSPEVGGYFSGGALGNTAVAADLAFGLVSSTTPKYNFTKVPGIVLFKSQSVEAIVQAPSQSCGYGAAGQQLVGNGNGFAHSVDGGASFRFVNVSALNTLARYGAYPTASTFYISAGTWPEGGSVRGDGAVAVTSRLSVHPEKGAAFRLDAADGAAYTNASNGTGWSGQIVRSTDAGQTWTSVFEDDSFYFNAIDCWTETSCVAVGEADNGPEPGVRIYTTTDGVTWARTFFDGDANMSLMAARWSSATEVWAAGGHLSGSAFYGVYHRSTDAGATWTTVTVPNAYGVDLSFVSVDEGYAVGLTLQSSASLLRYA